jgi:hypothetical protein
MEPWRAMNAHIEPMRVRLTLLADSHYIDEEQDPGPDPDPH